MAGDRPAAMVRTPWGDASELRAKMLRPGRGTPREEAERNQRERLFAAMVATVAEKGYEATTVADLVELSGVSRSAFYRHFDDKQDCFLAAVEALVEPTIGAVAEADGRPPGLEGARQAFDSFIGLLVDQPAASRMCFVEVYAAGPEAVGNRPSDRRLRGLLRGGARRDAGARGDATGDRAGDDRRAAEGDPQAPLSR